MSGSDWRDEEIPAELIGSVRINKARKQHDCGNCTQPILKGQSYERLCVRIEGTIYTHKQHNSACAYYEPYWENA